MHDWTLCSIYIDWASANAKIELKDAASKVIALEIKGLSLLVIPRKNPWGESVSINEVIQINKEGEELRGLNIEMQSGDIIEIEAKLIELI
ncbi:hypothetical protein [Pseudomonas indica]|uniref:hypothetical protein n=1 Tax=Pseudomonas indica TaxID=137658 RepID=UPI000BC862B9|nr:hypothetical protein [Pseudomonas indica]PAU62773.1 hypothetical protein BZL42_05525 [Pseudomonas indica]